MDPRALVRMLEEGADAPELLVDRLAGDTRLLATLVDAIRPSLEFDTRHRGSLETVAPPPRPEL
jgi:hypothetical protein